MIALGGPQKPRWRILVTLLPAKLRERPSGWWKFIISLQSKPQYSTVQYRGIITHNDLYTVIMIVYCQSYWHHIQPYKKNQIEEKAKVSLLFGRRTWMPHYSHLAARMIWTKVFGRKSIWEDGGSVRCKPDDHPFFRNFRPSVRSSIHPFLLIILVLNL